MKNTARRKDTWRSWDYWTKRAEDLSVVVLNCKSRGSRLICVQLGAFVRIATWQRRDEDRVKDFDQVQDRRTFDCHTRMPGPLTSRLLLRKKEARNDAFCPTQCLAALISDVGEREEKREPSANVVKILSSSSKLCTSCSPHIHLQQQCPVVQSWEKTISNFLSPCRRQDCTVSPSLTRWVLDLAVCVGYLMTLIWYRDCRLAHRSRHWSLGMWIEVAWWLRSRSIRSTHQELCIGPRLLGILLDSRSVESWWELSRLEGHEPLGIELA